MLMKGIRDGMGLRTYSQTPKYLLDTKFFPSRKLNSKTVYKDI